MNPFSEVIEFIKSNKETSSAIGLAKLILSLQDSTHSFSITDCVRPLDRDNSVVALGIIENYMEIGETQDLINAANEVIEIYPNINEL